MLHSGGNLCDGVESCRRAVRAQVGRGVDVIKIATTGGVNSQVGAGLGQQMFEDEARAIVETAKLYGKKVAVHAHGADGIAVALAAGRRLDRARHHARRRDDRDDGEAGHLLRADALDRERLHRAARHEP